VVRIDDVVTDLELTLVRPQVLEILEAWLLLYCCL
jgi:hypothetical protein